MEIGREEFVVMFSFQDGQIDFYEFMTVLHVMSRGSSEDNLRQIFRVFDINRDGRISMEEMEKIVKDFQLGNMEEGCLVKTGGLAEITFYQFDFFFLSI